MMSRSQCMGGGQQYGTSRESMKPKLLLETKRSVCRELPMVFYAIVIDEIVVLKRKTTSKSS
jgi:hypothetical protein